ncbi:putative GH3 domain-containing protein [Hypsibius exemplaris]|uniref:GH3 domain-containing protein n=1 Tax=Hypsibius exemplaris TaxID=2072580 RepID=A0A9X6RKK5_HYPEX|nr:putative GH3 domain-containing protein [Hypsibius exemplaris]
MAFGFAWSAGLTATGIFLTFCTTKSIFLALICALLILFALVLLDILSRDVSALHTWRSAADQYLALTVLGRLGCYCHGAMLKDTENLSNTQEELLKNFLSANAATEYGKRYEFARITSREDFVRVHPLTGYGMSRAENVRRHFGDVGEDECIALFTEAAEDFFPTWHHGDELLHGEGVSGVEDAEKECQVFLSTSLETLCHWHPDRPNSSSPASTKSILHLYTTPAAGFEIPTEPETSYVHLLFCLKDRELGMMEANFASLIYYAFQFLEANWRDLVVDIAPGSVKNDLDVTDEVRRKLNLLLRPDVARAEELRQAFQSGVERIASRIWPKLNLICAWTVERSPSTRPYFGKSIPIYSPLYAATEGLIGLNIWPLAASSRYLLVPRAMVFEFIRLEDMDSVQPQTLFLEQAQLGESYELVITNASGLCRYRFGDVVKVVDFLNQCPVVEFLYRKGQLLNVRGEKLSENVVCGALDAVIRANRTHLVDYTTAESHFIEPVKAVFTAPYYVIFIELSPEVTQHSLKLEQFQAQFDRELCEQSYVYESFRTNGSIGPAQTFLCKPGTFVEFRQFLLLNTESSANQVKIPRVLRKSEQVRFLMDRSTATPTGEGDMD